MCGPANETTAADLAGPAGADTAAPIDAADPGELEPEAGAAVLCQVLSAGEPVRPASVATEPGGPLEPSAPVAGQSPDLLPAVSAQPESLASLVAGFDPKLAQQLIAGIASVDRAPSLVQAASPVGGAMHPGAGRGHAPRSRSPRVRGALSGLSEPAGPPGTGQPVPDGPHEPLPPAFVPEVTHPAQATQVSPPAAPAPKPRPRPAPPPSLPAATSATCLHFSRSAPLLRQLLGRQCPTLLPRAGPDLGRPQPHTGAFVAPQPEALDVDLRDLEIWAMLTPELRLKGLGTCRCQTVQPVFRGPETHGSVA